MKNAQSLYAKQSRSAIDSKNHGGNLGSLPPDEREEIEKLKDQFEEKDDETSMGGFYEYQEDYYPNEFRRDADVMAFPET